MCSSCVIFSSIPDDGGGWRNCRNVVDPWSKYLFGRSARQVVAFDTRGEAVAGHELAMGDLWSDRPQLVTMVRRLGCPLCRQWAKDLSQSVVPELRELGFGTVLVSWDEQGVDEFREGGFWAGDLLLLDDPPAGGSKALSAYKMLGTKRESIWTGFGLLDAETRESYVRVRARGGEGGGVGGNFLVGDGLQQGATLVVMPGGDVVFLHVQQKASDHPQLQELRAAAVEGWRRHREQAVEAQGD